MGAYVEVIKQAILFFPVIAFLFTMPYIVYNYHKYGSVLSLRILIVYSFILYLICVYFLVILPLPSREFVATLDGPRMQLVPFCFLGDMVKESGWEAGNPDTYLQLVTNRAFFQVLFNIFMTVPFGVYLRYYFRFSLRKTVLSTFALSLFFELTQLSGLYFYYPRSYRLFDVDDLMANTLGGMLGYVMVKPFLSILPSRAKIDADSLRRGQEVSLLRRLTALFFDFLCAGFAALAGGIVIPLFGMDAPYLQILLFFAYFILTPCLLHGMTIGKKITKTRIAAAGGGEAHWYQYAIRYGCVGVMVCFVPLLWIFWILYAAVMMAQHKRLFYERLSGTAVVSTIPVE